MEADAAVESTGDAQPPEVPAENTPDIQQNDNLQTTP
jgi:hypothetical protein